MPSILLAYILTVGKPARGQEDLFSGVSVGHKKAPCICVFYLCSQTLQSLNRPPRAVPFTAGSSTRDCKPIPFQAEQELCYLHTMPNV